MRIARTAAAASSVAVLMSAGLAMAAPASAGQTWIQSVQRPSQAAACPASNGPAPQSGWVVTAWEKSWELWPNGSTGGWTCTRSITWANDGPEQTRPADEPPILDGFPAGVGCILSNDGDNWVDFEGGWFLEEQAPIWTNASCTSPEGTTYSRWLVHAPAGYDPNVLCLAASGTPEDGGPYGDDVYQCVRNDV